MIEVPGKMENIGNASWRLCETEKSDLDQNRLEFPKFRRLVNIKTRHNHYCFSWYFETTENLFLLENSVGGRNGRIFSQGFLQCLVKVLKLAKIFILNCLTMTKNFIHLFQNPGKTF